MKKINVMHITYSLDVGGAEAVILALLAKLDRDQYSPSICSFQDGGKMSALFEKEDIPVHVIEKHSGKDWRLPFKLAALFRKEKVDIIHPHNAYMWMYSVLAAKVSGVKGVVLTEHANLRNPSRLYNYLFKFLQHFTDKFTVNSQQVADVLISDGVQQNKVILIPNGIDIEASDAIETNFNKYRNQLRISGDEVVLGMVARLAPPKDFDTLFTAMKTLLDNGYNATLLIAGGGPEEENLKILAKNLAISKSIRFLGFRSDITQLLNVMDIFILSSLKEGQSIAILEAMTRHLPVIATATGGTPELIDNNQSGLLIPAKDHAALTSALVKLIDNPDIRKMIGDAGRKQIEERYNFTDIINRYQDIYKACYDKRSFN